MDYARTRVDFDHYDQFDFEKRILLVRHPCDVMVSYHFHRTVRRKARASISALVRSERIGIPSFSRCYVEWSKRKNGQMVVRYEDMFGAEVWIDMLGFFDIPFHEEAFDKAIEATKFDNIRSNLEEIATFPSAWRYLAAEHGKYGVVKPKNSEAHKFRRGKVGGYVDYMNENDIEYVLDNFTLGESLELYRQRYLLESKEH